MQECIYYSGQLLICILFLELVPSGELSPFLLILHLLLMAIPYNRHFGIESHEEKPVSQLQRPAELDIHVSR